MIKTMAVIDSENRGRFGLDTSRDGRHNVGNQSAVMSSSQSSRLGLARQNACKGRGVWKLSDPSVCSMLNSNRQSFADLTFKPARACCNIDGKDETASTSIGLSSFSTRMCSEQIFHLPETQHMSTANVLGLVSYLPHHIHLMRIHQQSMQCANAWIGSLERELVSPPRVNFCQPLAMRKLHQLSTGMSGWIICMLKNWQPRICQAKKIVGLSTLLSLPLAVVSVQEIGTVIGFQSFRHQALWMATAQMGAEIMNKDHTSSPFKGQQRASENVNNSESIVAPNHNDDLPELPPLYHQRKEEKHQYNEIEVSPGVFMPLISAQETWKAIQA
jgi:hypothetical protein